jgi:hypothetical protein
MKFSTPGELSGWHTFVLGSGVLGLMILSTFDDFGATLFDFFLGGIAREFEFFGREERGQIGKSTCKQQDETLE